MKWKSKFVLICVLLLLNGKHCEGKNPVSVDNDSGKSTAGWKPTPLYAGQIKPLHRHTSPSSTESSVKTEVPIQRKVKLPMILTPLPSANEDKFSSKINEEGADTKDKSDTNSDHSEHAQDIPKPRMTEHDRPTQGGTDSKTRQHKPSPHYDITSPGLRWTAYELRTEATQKTRKRYKKKKNKLSQRAVDVGEDNDEDDNQRQSRSLVNYAAIGAGVMVFLFIFAGLARLWGICKKRCSGSTYPDPGCNFNSLPNISEQLSEEEIIFERTNLNCGTRTSRDSATHKPEPNPPSYRLAATHFDAQSPWTLRDTPTSTPLMAVSAECSDCSPGENICVAVDIPEPNLLSKKPTACTIVDLSESSPVSVVIDAPESDSCAVVDVPDLSSPDTSFSCSSLKDTPKSTPLMAVSAGCSDSSPKENICVAVDIPEPNLLYKESTASTIVDLSESSPVSVVIDAPESDSCAVVDVPDLSSPDTSFSCSSLKETPKSTPLMAVSADCSDSSPRENICVADDIPEPNLLSKEPPACTIVDLSESSPDSVVIDAPEADSVAVVDVPDLSSPNTSFTCSSLKDTPKSTPLMAVSGCSMEKSCVTVDIPEPNPVSEEPASCIVDLSETSPVCVVVDAPKVDSCVAVIPEMNSPDTSFTCSSLFDDAFSWFSSSSLTSVSSLDITSAEPEASSLTLEPETYCSSPTLNSTEALEPKLEITYHHAALATVEQEVVIHARPSEPSIPVTIEPESSLPTAENQPLLETSLTTDPATPKQSSSFDLSPSVSGESTHTVSLATEIVSSSQESCKTPVAATDDVMLTIEDDEGEVFLHASNKLRAETTIMSLNSENEERVTQFVESLANDTSGETTKPSTVEASGVTANVKDSCAENGNSDRKLLPIKSKSLIKDDRSEKNSCSSTKNSFLISDACRSTSFTEKDLDISSSLFPGLTGEKQTSDLAIELESEHGATEVIVKGELLNVIAEDFEQAGITKQTEHHSVLNANADVFIPRFQATGGPFESAERFGKLERGITGQSVLNAEANEFIPCFEADRRIKTENFCKLELGITGGRNSLNVNAKEFVPVDFQNSASVSLFAQPEHDVVPIASPAQPRPVKKRRRARRRKNHSQDLQQPKDSLLNRINEAEQE